ncbi:PQQ-dependent sugar dehydrogenase [Sphingomonas sp. LY29]|uniref:PQQ-dependent sugar dehydrogenase n=1 Tax=Sphingomonas sp. LY29 TaxID=3095341 RepID=UPI002D777DDA|nr:PQQ-dependent sugar dehydrogenase [Sphingomonas sp. LY29]WRP25587.1 PQQ-dependent sugar dehydrogenase [Sphingomonas sp. LY29]
MTSETFRMERDHIADQTPLRGVRARRQIWQGALLLCAAACGGPGGASSQQGSAPATAAGTPFQTTQVAQFTTPWAIAFLPGRGNSALVTEKEGKLWLVDAANGRKTAVAGVPMVKADGQGGLGDVVPHPDFARNGRVYLTWVEGGANGTSGAVLGYAQLAMAGGKPTLQGLKTIWRQSPKVEGNGHFSHRIAFGPDGLLYLSSGDRQKFDPAQDLGGNLGKVLRLTAEGTPAPGNPWASRGGVAAEFWSIGHRNILGLSFAPDGRLWESEMGPKGGDEVNLVQPGKNYGWPKASDGSHYDGRDIPDHRAGDGFEPPKVNWTPSISPGGLMIYSGDRFAAWKGDALVPALSGKSLIRVDINGDQAAKADQWEMEGRIRAVAQGPDGAVYLLEDGGRGSQGRMLRLDPPKP